MKYSKRIIWTALFLFCGARPWAQGAPQIITLQKAIETALNNNIGVRQSGLLAQAAAVGHQQARANLLPSVNGSVNHGINQGRSIDPFTNAYVNQQINYGVYSLGGSVVLFNGLSLQHTLRQNAYAYDAAKMEWQQERDNLTLRVILAYLQVLNNEDLVEVARRQAAVTRQQLERLEVLHRQGATSPPLIADLRGQLKTEELAIVNSLGTLETARLALSQLMNVPYSRQLQPERIGMEELLNRTPARAEEVYAAALEHLALVKAAELRKKSAAYGVKAVRGELFPVLFFNGNLNTNYSSAARRDVLVNTVEAPTADFVVVNGSRLPVVAKQNTFNTERIYYNDQVRNNISSSVGVGLRIPVFNALQVRNRVKLARIELQQVALQEENTKVELRQSIELAVLNRENAWERYRLSLEQVAAYTESFRAAEIRFASGVGTSVDYLVAKANLDRANSNLVMAKYDYILRNRILQFYTGQ